jgi:transcriptional regulator with XRE-family HTH domain
MDGLNFDHAAMGGTTMPAAKTKRIEPTDEYVGKRIRQRRMMLDVSQSGLGDALGLTFQQVQKYEKGTNRVSASKLQTIANFLKVPVSFFFEGSPADPNGGRKTASPEFTFADLLATSDGVALCTAFDKIESKAVRRSVVSLIETLAAQQ